MARFLFGDDIAAFVIEPPSSHAGNVQALTEATGTVWDVPEGGTQYTDLLDADGTTPRDDIATDANGFLVPFYAPDGVVVVWLDFGAGRQLLISSDAVEQAAELAALGGAFAVDSVNGQVGDVLLTADDVGAAEVGHNHDGSEITSGTVAFARLPVGTGATEIASGDHPHALGGLTDVTTAGASTGQVLTRQSSGSWAPANPSGGGGVSEHSQLSGLGADDHPHYHTDGRGDARYHTQTIANGRFVVFVDVVTGSEARPTGAGRVMWVGGETQPTNMATGDVWLSSEAS